MASSKGLEGIVAGNTSLSLVEGEIGRLSYRGYSIRELAEKATYEEVVYLLWQGELPTPEQLAEFNARSVAERAVPEGVIEVLRLLAPDAAPMDALRTGASALGSLLPKAQGTTIEGALALTARIPTILAAYHRLRQGQAPLAPRSDLGHAANYLYMLTGNEPTAAQAYAIDRYFILLADHGFNASTFTGRIVASTLSDMCSAVVAAIGALKGPLHGGAPSEVLKMLNAIGSKENAEPWIGSALAHGERLMGFGHRVYKAEDPRADVLRDLASHVARRERFEFFETVEREALRLLEEAKPGRRLYTNVEYYSAVVLDAVGLPGDFFTPTFAASRTAGWTAHVLEQMADNRLIRPHAA
ncbi:MAG TPA: citrate synthase/methylcitrate synthase, partial [Chloroflexi bacterium]|nr:citrate synthase/methylcitrate synthase [Chloroflexota bacterium]